MTPEELARQALTADAAFCVTGGTVVAIGSPVLARWLGLPAPLIGTAGTTTAVWGGWVFLGAGTPDWQKPTAVAAVANVIAAKGLGLVGLTRDRKSARVALLASSGVITGFAAAQGLALLLDRRQRARQAEADDTAALAK